MEEEKYKVCFKCGINKPLSEFYKHSQMADGHLGKCKECAKKDVTDNRKLREDFYKVYDRVRSYSEHRKEKQRKYRRKEDVKERHNIANNKWCENNQAKRKAQTAVRRAVLAGKLIKQPCFVCGVTENIEAHHCNYDAPLDVTWLCTKHHGEVHRDYDEQRDKEILENTIRGNVWDTRKETIDETCN